MTRSRPTPEGPTARPTPPELPLFERVLLHDIDVPDIRTPAPIAPGSDTSRAAAESVTDPIRRRSHRLILAALATVNAPITREDLSGRCGIKESSLCARLSELCPVWVRCIDSGGVAVSGMRVNTYALTAAGLHRWQQANEPLSGRGSKEEAA